MKFWKVNAFKISIVLISIIILLLLIFWMPQTANYFQEIAPEYAYMKLPLLIGINLTGIPFFIAVFNVFKLLGLVTKGAVFTMDSIDYLNNISKSCISEIILYSIGLLYTYIENAIHPGIVAFSLMIIFVGFVIYIFIEILKELLLKAVEIKTENEFTI